MPNADPLIRAMVWDNVKNKMPNSVSKHHPDGDPVQNRKQIQNRFQRMSTFGPRAMKHINQYVEGKITEDELEERLDSISEDINNKELEQFRQNLNILSNHMDVPVWKEMVPFVSTIDTGKLYSIASELNDINVYDNNTEKIKEFESS